jgi:hypothetical protein
MTDKNKRDDLTSIEDLGEFEHAENGTAFTDFTLEETPLSHDPDSTDVDGLDFGTSEEFPLLNEGNKEEPFFAFPDEMEKKPDEMTVSDVPLFGEDEPISDLVKETLSGKSESENIRSLSFDSSLGENSASLYAPETVYKQAETFEEIKRFAEESSFSGMGAEGNPSFTVLLRQVKFVEDMNDILILLKELQLMSDTEEETRKRLTRGHLLIPRISEFAAILLTHKLRRFDIDIQMGLSDEIHPPKHHEAPEAGLSSKHSLHQNQSHNFHFDHPKLEISQIIISATPTLQGYQVIRYLGVASEHRTVLGDLVEDESNEEVPRYYQELAQKLRAHAVKAHSNAIVGLNYQLTPIPSEYGGSGHKYRLSCTGNLVWVNKL